MNYKNWLKRVITATLAGAMVLSLAACGADDENGGTKPANTDVNESSFFGETPPWRERENETVKVRAYFTKGMTGLANQYAIANGWYADAGIDLEVLDTTEVVAAFGAGEIDIADGDPSTYIPAISNGIDIKVVSNMWRNRGAYWVIARNGIDKVEDLAGKTVGSARPSGGMRLTLNEVLTSHGLNPDSDVDLVANGTHADAYATLVTGEVDATIIHQPYATLAQEEGNGVVLAKTWEYLPDYHTGVLVATGKLIDEQPEVLERVLEVYFYVNKLAKENLDDFIPWAAEYLNISETTAKNAIESEIELWENDPIVDVDRLQVTQDLLYKNDMQKEAYQVETVVDNTFADKIAKQLGLGRYSEGS